MKNINQDKIIKYLRWLICRVLLLVVIFLGLAILCKKNADYKNLIVSYIYEDNISFPKIKKFYNKYLGGIFPFDTSKVDDSIMVFNEELEYLNDSLYLDGAKLEVAYDYLVPAVSEGMVIFIGEKEDYGNVVIVSTIDDKNIWYGNINDSSIKLYDYINKGDYLGMAKGNYLYLVCSSDNKFIDYKECLI